MISINKISKIKASLAKHMVITKNIKKEKNVKVIYYSVKAAECIDLHYYNWL